MKLSQIVRLLAERRGMPREQVWQLVDVLFDEMTRALQRGEQVKVRNFGTFQWTTIRGRRYRLPTDGRRWITRPPTRRVRFLPSSRLQPAEEQDMDKYGVKLGTPPPAADGEKTANIGERCTRCGRQLDAARSCEEHGTEPLEKKPEGGQHGA